MRESLILTGAQGGNEVMIFHYRSAPCLSPPAALGFSEARQLPRRATDNDTPQSRYITALRLEPAAVFVMISEPPVI